MKKHYLLIIMLTKRACYAILLQCILYNLSFASAVIGQDIEKIKVSINVENANLEEVFQSIEKQTGFAFAFNKSIVQNSKTHSFHYNQENLKLVLEDLGKIFRLNFRQINQTISVSPVPPGEEIIEEKIIELDKDIQGKVIDGETGEPLPGASVVVTGTTVGTITDIDGNFSITIPGNANSLTISYIGFKTEEVAIGDQTVFDITLSPDVEALEELVVIGYGTLKKENTSSAIEKLKVDDLDPGNDISVIKMMQGRVPGVHISSQSGTPGGHPNIMIRGIGSLTGGTTPLYVIDGVPGSLPPLNNADILSIEILKDASAAAIYGSRANNGVVIITTKSGQSGKTKFNVDARHGVGFIYNDIEVANTDEFLRVHNTARINHNNQWGLSENRLVDGQGHAYMAPLADPRGEGHQDTNWMDAIQRDQAKSYFFSLSASGGSDKTTFYSSFSSNLQQGIVRKSQNQQHTFRLKLGHEISDDLKVNFNFSGGYNAFDAVLTTHNTVKLIRYAREEQPFLSPYKEDGSYMIGGVDLPRHNPVQTINEMDEEDIAYRGNAYIDLEFTPIEGFTYKPSINIYGNLVDYNRVVYDKHPKAGSWADLVQERNIGSRIVLNNIFSYENNWNALEYKLMAGHAYEHSQYDVMGVIGNEYPSNSFRWLNSAGQIQDYGSSFDESALESYLGRATLIYDDRYILNLAIRRDGSSKFSEGERYGNFPSASAAWRLSNESFYPKSSIFSDVKLRGSYGVTGSLNGIGSYDAISTVQTGVVYNGESGLGIQHLGQSLTWEKAQQVNFGVDLSMLNGKYTFTADVYQQTTSDLLYRAPVHSTSGYTTVSRNIGELSNKGIELSADANILVGEFKWSANGNISFMKNELTSLLQETDTIPYNNNHALIVGKPISAFYMYKQTGIYQYDTEVPKPLYEKGVRAGDVIYEDLNHDGDITAEDRQYVGKAIPDFYGGFTNTFSYKNFELNIFCQYSYGNDVAAWWRGAGESSGGTEHLGYKGNMNIGKDVAQEYWHGPGTSNTVPRPITTESNNLHNVEWSTRFLEDASYLKVKTLTLAYNLPLHTLDKFMINNARVFFTVDNFLTFTNYSGYDPETSLDSNPGASNYGIDYGDQPILRTFLIGANIQF